MRCPSYVLVTLPVIPPSENLSRSLCCNCVFALRFPPPKLAVPGEGRGGARLGAVWVPLRTTLPAGSSCASRGRAPTVLAVQCSHRKPERYTYRSLNTIPASDILERFTSQQLCGNINRVSKQLNTEAKRVGCSCIIWPSKKKQRYHGFGEHFNLFIRSIYIP